MRVGEVYSHLNGLEYIHYHKKELWDEVLDVIDKVDAKSHKTKVSKEKTMKGKLLYSPTDINADFKEEFKSLGWQRRIRTYAVTSSPDTNREILALDYPDQKAEIEKRNLELIRTSNETDFVKDRIAVEVQFGKYSFVAYDLFVKHMAFFSLVASLI